MKSHFAVALLLCTLQLTALHARVLTQGNMRRLDAAPSKPVQSALVAANSIHATATTPRPFKRRRLCLFDFATCTLRRQMFRAAAGHGVSLLHPGRQMLASAAAAAAASAAGDAAAAAAAAASGGQFICV